MKKAILLAVVLALFCGPGFAAGQTANGGAVTLNAIIPAYVGFIGQSTQSVNFDYTNFGAQVAVGSATKLADVVPTWTLMYNLSGTQTIHLCAYATPLAGSGSYSIPTSSLYAKAIGSTSTLQFNQDGCGQTGNVFVLPDVSTPSSSTNKQVGFSDMFLQTPAGTAVPPDNYTGTLNIVAQVQ